MNKVIDLRNSKFNAIPDNKTGIYQFWCNEEVLNRLLGNFKETLCHHLTSKEIEGEVFYYIYVGIAAKESLNSRLKWHISQKHTPSAIKSGFLSTLRQSISSLIENQLAEEKTNNLLDKMIIEYQTYDYPIKSEEAVKNLLKIEKMEMRNNHLPLNIKDNSSTICKNFLTYLKTKRKSGKQC